MSHRIPNRFKMPKRGKFSRLQLRTKNTDSAKLNHVSLSSGTQKISRFFAKSNSSTASSADDVDSPEIQKGADAPENDEMERERVLVPDPQKWKGADETDFLTPKVTRARIAGIFEPKTKAVKSQSKRGRSTRKQISEVNRKFLYEQNDTGINREHLELAIALSKSIQDQEYIPGSTIDNFPNTQEKKTIIKKKLSEFGFVSDRSSNVTPRYEKIISEKTKEKKKWKIQPTLFLRTAEDRQRKIQEKITAILKASKIKTSDIDIVFYEENPLHVPHSAIDVYYSHGSPLFKRANFAAGVDNMSLFYVKDLIQPTESKPGALLRDWGSILGREVTPPRELPVCETESDNILRESISPKEVLSGTFKINNAVFTEKVPKNSSGCNTSPSPVIKEISKIPEELHTLAEASLIDDIFTEKVCQIDKRNVSAVEISQNIRIEPIKTTGIKEIPILDEELGTLAEASLVDDIFSDKVFQMDERERNVSPVEITQNIRIQPIKTPKNVHGKHSESTMSLTPDLFNDTEDYSLGQKPFPNPNETFTKATKKHLTESPDSGKFNSSITVNKRGIMLYESYDYECEGITENVLDDIDRDNAPNISAHEPEVIDLTQPETFCDLTNSSNENRNASDISNDSFNLPSFAIRHTKMLHAKSKSFQDILPDKDRTPSFKRCHSFMQNFDYEIETAKNVSLKNHSNLPLTSGLFPSELSIGSCNGENLSQSSQTDTDDSVIVVSDEELNYSCSTPYRHLNLNTTKEKCKSEIVQAETPKSSQRILKRKSVSQLNITRNSVLEAFPEDSQRLRRYKSFNCQSPKKIASPIHSPKTCNILDETYQINTSMVEVDPPMDISCRSFGDETYRRNLSMIYTKDKSKMVSPLVPSKISNSLNETFRLNTTVDQFDPPIQSPEPDDLAYDMHMSPSDLMDYDPMEFHSEITSKYHNGEEQYKFDSPTSPEESITTGHPNQSITSDSFLTNVPTDVLPHLQPDSPCKRTANLIQTPKGNRVIKLHDITPMPNYEHMDTPERIKELEKYGLKPLSKTRGLQLLRYIYEQTHPIIGGNNTVQKQTQHEGNEHDFKRRRLTKTPTKKRCSLDKFIPGPIEHIEIAGDVQSERDSDEHLIFERKPSVKIASCRLPFHIAWHNFVASHPEIRRKILQYIPIQLEEIHAQFKELGFKYHVNDILTYLDRRCITVRTNQTGRKTKSKS